MLTYIEALAKATTAAGIVRDVECVPRRPADTPRKKQTRTRDGAVHVVVRVEKGLQCVVCRRLATRPAAMKGFAAQPCEGSSAARLVLNMNEQYAVSNGHKLWMTGSVVWCATCGCHSTRRLRGLAYRCGTRLVQEAAKRNLAEGKAPTARRKDAATYRPVRLTTAAWRAWRAASE
jgi:hypothetical protein